MKGSEFTRDDILWAESIVGFPHPILTVLDREVSRISAVTQAAVALPDNQDDSQYVREKSGFLVDAIEDAAPFTLYPLDLVAIWSRYGEFRRHRYLMATALSISYAIQGVSKPEIWKRFPRRYVENGFPPGVATDRDGLTHVKAKLEEISATLDTLELVTYGTSETTIGLGSKLAKRMRDGDLEAEQEYRDLQTLINKRKIPLLNDLTEAFGTGMTPVKLDIEDALEGRL
ncbi:MAG: hypothetical protein C4584_00815 [Armatimonadetes bacterium]|nr:MAG: hypothetical protein C4584_00815 [Armatimonadota bacterium]